MTVEVGTKFQRRLVNHDTGHVIPFGRVWEVNEVYDSHVVLWSDYQGESHIWNVMTNKFDDTIHRAGYIVVTDDTMVQSTEQQEDN